MARFCFLPPTKRPTSTRCQTTKQKERKGSSSMSDGMLKRLEPVFIPKKRVKGINSLKNKTEIAKSPKQIDEVQNVVKNCQQTPKKFQPKVKSQKSHQPPPRKTIRRELFPQKEEDEGIRNVLEIVDEQNKESKEVMNDQFIFPNEKQSQENSCKMTEGEDDTQRKNDGFKKPKSLPKISKKRRAKQRSINKSVLEIIRKTHQSIQKIRNQGISGTTLTDISTESNQENRADESKKAKTSLNVQVSICIPNSGIQKSKCTVQQSGSVEEEDIGYKHVGIKSFQNNQGVL